MDEKNYYLSWNEIMIFISKHERYFGKFLTSTCNLISNLIEICFIDVVDVLTCL